MFLLLESDLHSFADDNTLMAIRQTIEELKSELKGKAERAVDWIENNDMIASPEKRMAIVLAKETQNIDTFQMNISGKGILRRIQFTY